MPSQLQPPYLNTPLTQIISLDSGLPAVVVNGLAAGQTGVALSQIFTVSERPGGGDRNLSLQAQGAGVTGCTVDIEVSADGGTTWNKKHVGVALITASVSTLAVEANMQAGLQYRINPTSVAGAAVTIIATAN
jgi:hypothetical protein